MGVFYKNRNYEKRSFKYEKDFEEMVFSNSKLFFGENTILIDTKAKISGKGLGKTIPDGFLFDFSDKDDIKFYLIEVELACHGFYDHIFKQITKFFSFLRSGNPLQSELVDKLYGFISESDELLCEVKSYIGNIELYKFLKDTIENSQDILIIIDDHLPEFDHIRETYTDTWDKCVKVLQVAEYYSKGESIYTVFPDFNEVASEIEMRLPEDAEDENYKYTEDYHLENKTDFVKDVYRQLRTELTEFTFNPQKYYISLKGPKNFAFIKFTKKFIRVIVLLPEHEVAKSIKIYQLQTPTQRVQDFYNGSCTYIYVKDMSELENVIKVIRLTANYRASMAA